MTLRIELDDQGFPVALADGAPSLAPASPAPQTSSGPSADSPSPSAAGGPLRPIGVGPQEWIRRMDAVREAAREFETLTAQDIRERLRGITNRELTEGELIDFASHVREQQLADLLDVLDQAERGKKRGRRTVRIQAPRGYVRKTLHALSDEELRQLSDRLRSRGWTNEQIKSGLMGRLTDARLSKMNGTL